MASGSRWGHTAINQCFAAVWRVMNCNARLSNLAGWLWRAQDFSLFMPYSRLRMADEISVISPRRCGAGTQETNAT